ncbi:MAG: hypothetical protein KDA89_03425 [Planctomycetaceae bacterium]|nr:hypothetical protein [Planctomycetaceae bacterium]
MTKSFPPELARFVESELRSGQFADENALLTAALEVYREVKLRHQDVRDRIEASQSQAQHGETAALDIDAIVAELASELDEYGQPR